MFQCEYVLSIRIGWLYTYIWGCKVYLKQLIISEEVKYIWGCQLHMRQVIIPWGTCTWVPESRCTVMTSCASCKPAVSAVVLPWCCGCTGCSECMGYRTGSEDETSTCTVLLGVTPTPLSVSQSPSSLPSTLSCGGLQLERAMHAHLYGD